MARDVQRCHSKCLSKMMEDFRTDSNQTSACLNNERKTFVYVLTFAQK